jgi:holliday junction DNA helicase RuvB
MYEITLSPQEEALFRKSTPRPTTWDGVIGNDRAKRSIRTAIAAARQESRVLPHTLLYGAPGTGKTTMANLIAQEMWDPVNPNKPKPVMLYTTAAAIRSEDDILRFCWDLSDCYDETKELDEHNNVIPGTGKYGIIFIDEIHGLAAVAGQSKIPQESLFPWMEDFKFPHSRENKPVMHKGRVKYPTVSVMRCRPFTIIGATTDPGNLSAPLRRRFLLQVKMEPYRQEEIERIMLGSAERLGWSIEPEAAAALSRYSRLAPGRSYQLLQSAHDLAVATNRTAITPDIVAETIELSGLHPEGLDDTDIAILIMLADRPKGVGLTEISRSIGYSQNQVSELQEPWLRQLKFIETQHRRVITWRGLLYLARHGFIRKDRADVKAALDREAQESVPEVA